MIVSMAAALIHQDVPAPLTRDQARNLINDALLRVKRARLTEGYWEPLSELNNSWGMDIRLPDEELAKAAAFFMGAPHEVLTDGSLPIVSAVDLVERHADYRPVLINGLLREGETMNVIASPKTGKSWLVLLMAFKLAHGMPFLGRPCSESPVLIIDNELHPETAAQRLKEVGKALGLSPRGIHLSSLRGQLRDLLTLQDRIVDAAVKLEAKVIILDALYRLLPSATSENDNAAMAGIYNALDAIAAETGAAMVCIHHSSKGNQADRSVTDGGAGAGAISRAADSHVFLREHETEGCVTVDAVTRSFPPSPSFVVRRVGVLWERADQEDPSRIKGKKPGAGTGAKAADLVDLVSDEQTEARVILAEARNRLRLSADRVRQLLSVAVRDGLLHESTGRRGVRCYSRKPVAEPGSIYEQVRNYLSKHPLASNAEVATACRTTDRTVRRIRNGADDPADDRPDDPADDHRDGADDPISAPYKGAHRGRPSSPADSPGSSGGADDGEDLFVRAPVVGGR